MKKNTSSNHVAGLTLVETLIYIAIIGIVIMGLMSFGWSVSNSRSKTYSVQEVQANIRLVFNLFSQKMRLADNVIVPVEGGEAEELILDMPNAQPNLSFSLSEGTLFLTEGAGEPQPLTSNRVVVSDLSFTNLAGPGERDNILLKMTISYDSSDQAFSYSQVAETAAGLMH